MYTMLVMDEQLYVRYAWLVTYMAAFNDAGIAGHAIMLSRDGEEVYGFGRCTEI